MSNLRYLLRRTLVFMVTLTLVSSYFMQAPPRALAVTDPPGCSLSGVRLVTSRTPLYLHVGETITYSVGVRNPSTTGYCNASQVTLKLRTPDGVEHTLIPEPGISLPVGATSPTYTVTYTVRPQDVAVDRVTAMATATGMVHDSPIRDDPFTATQNLTSLVYIPALSAAKTGVPAEAYPGDPIEYTLRICNTGNVTLQKISATDSLAGDVAPLLPDSLAKGACASAVVSGPIPADPADPYPSQFTATYRDSLNHADSVVTATGAAAIDILYKPTAVADAYAALEDGTLTVPAGGVLANDLDTDHEPLSAILVAGPVHGTLTLNPDGSFTYRPNPLYHGVDSFTYKAFDGKLESDPATVTITIAHVNHPPTASGDAYTVNEDGTLEVPAPGVLANDTDLDREPITATLLTQPAQGSLVFNPDGSFTYTPNPLFHGTDAFTYTATDGRSSSVPATVVIDVAHVNHPAVAHPDVYEVVEGSSLEVGPVGVLANDEDADSDTLMAVLVAAPAHGQLTLNSDGSFIYTPHAQFFGNDAFSYKANDGLADSNPAEVSITVLPLNKPPVAVADAYAVPEDGTLTVPAPGLMANDSDPNSDPLTAVLVDGPAHGTLTLNADGSFVYQPAPLFHGTDSFTYKLNDGKIDSESAAVTITVSHVNHRPLATADAYSLNEDGSLTVPAPGLLTNDGDPDRDPITAVLVTGPNHGTLAVNPDGSFDYTPNPFFHGTDTFTYQVSDGQATSEPVTVTLTVAHVNHEPAAADDAYTVNEDETLAVDVPGVLANDTDPDSDSLTAVLVSGPAHGTLNLNSDGSFAYWSEPGFYGTDSFTYQASDGTTISAPATVVLTVNHVNHAPAGEVDVYNADEDGKLTVAAPGVLANDADSDNDELTAVPVADPASGTLKLNPDGSFEYTPEPRFYGTDTFRYEAFDGSLGSGEITVIIIVNHVNHKPEAEADTYTVAAGATLTVPIPGLLGNDTDVDGEVLRAALVTGPAHGTLTLDPFGSFIYIPAPGFYGTDSFTYVANDGQVDSEPATVTIQVDRPNQPLVATNDTYSVAKDGTLTVPAPGVLANDTDPDGDTLTAAVAVLPTSGTLTLNADGSFVYTPAAGYVGVVTFAYRVSDGRGSEAEATVTIKVGIVGSATRSHGYWKNHGSYANHIFEMHLGGEIDLGWVKLTTIGEVMAMLNANPDQRPDGSKRPALERARIQASVQAVAAFLNTGLTNGKPLPAGVTLESIRTTLASTDIKAIQALQKVLDEYVNSGKDVEIIDEHGTMPDGRDPGHHDEDDDKDKDKDKDKGNGPKVKGT